MTTDTASSAPVFPKAVRHGDTVYTSGLAAVDPSTLTPTSSDFDAQCADVLAQLDAALTDSGSSRFDVVKLDCFLAERTHFPAWNQAFATFFLGSVAGSTGAGIPARTTTITTLPIDGLLIEIHAIARTSKETTS
ncbi:MAG: RidA family protein [Corynebacteriales bacterium]|uniref:RidA family protein n=1 Tax=Williamsia herbipolensis TaxID=1603258 RepID=A0AAU4JXS6_9NOCA|nr:RidA family protein [Williamsia herbipolensis]MCX6469433.1 RidA family protein [Mycobacteriales bacterium]